MSELKLIDIHPLLSDKVRLSVMAALAASKEKIEFKVLIEGLELTKGNLSSHLRKLEDAGLVEVTKEFVDRRPKTSYELSSLGRQELESYLLKIESIIKSIRR
jgi:DNA-binding transcriptional ArsR family regulator